MTFKAGEPRPANAGRKEGISVNKRTRQLWELAREEDADPAPFLMKVMKGDKRALGYEDALIKRKRDYEIELQDYEERKATSRNPAKLKVPEPLRELTEAEEKELNLLPLDVRMEAAKELAPFIHGKRKPVDNEGNDKSDTLSEILEAIDANK